MKILHTADWHLGRVLHGYSLESYQADFLRFFVDLVRAEAPEAVVIAGDIFDRSVASTVALAMMDEALEQLSGLTQVIIIPGNHDSAARLGFGTGLYARRVWVFSKVSQVGTPVVLTAEYTADDEVVNIYPIPYLEPDAARFQLADAVSGELPGRSHQAVNAVAAQRIFTDLAGRPGIGIVVAHPFVAGSVTSESERDISVGGVQSISVDTFQDPEGRIRYVACGHLHRPQTLRLATDDDSYLVRYSGSPLPFSFSEASDSKSITRLIIEGGQVIVSEIAVPQPYSLATFKGTLAELEASELPTRDCYYSVEITDALRPERLFARVKEKLPLLMTLHYVETGSLDVAVHDSLRSVSNSEVTQHFYEQALGRELEPAELALVNEVWEQLRLQEATDEIN